MDEIAVEPVESVEPESRTDVDADLPAGVDAPEYVLYGGKGGVGKTTMAAATGLSSAAGGVDTLVVSTDPAHSLSDTYGVDVPATPARIREDVPLYAVEIDPDDAMEDGVFGAEGNPLGGLGDLGEMAGGPMAGDGNNGESESGGPGGGPAGGLLGGTMPGADEAAAMRQLLEYLDDPRFDRVIVDTAPTGHTLRLLELPELMDSMIGRVMQLRQRFSGMMDGLTGLFGGDADDADPSEDLDELRERIERLRSVLRDPSRTDFRIVMIPEEMSVVESERLLDRLTEFGIPVNTLVVNRVMEDLDDVADVDPEWVVSPNLADCEFCQRRWEVQQNALERAGDLFRGREVKRVPLLGDAVHGDAALRVVAACLE
ncbi:ArsA family ATPase [Halopenitus persicus]|uniref:Arsenite efflux ATP-binding protein ArsA n=1 Tax=Halopenitus persicus TaxID=1048396 RepID=A0A1H3G639_9EURY|nr:TRC40/GET3/ArsA family transport-energizing ATPase [Halopenitus persicus]SDX98736.1 arsenite efflux ATP-binding protein ArsA [Halopenitus persicus]